MDWSASISNSQFEGLNSIAARSFVCNSYLGYGSYVADRSVLIDTKVGRYCSLGPCISMPTGGIRPRDSLLHIHCFTRLPPIAESHTSQSKNSTSIVSLKEGLVELSGTMSG